MRRPLITILAAAALTGCAAAPSPAPQAAGSPPAPAVTTGATPSPSPVRSSAANAVPKTAAPASKKAADDYCPVTAEQLKAASPHAPAPFEKIECHEDVAMAVVPRSADPNGYDAAVYLFDHRASGWHEVAQGSALNCYEYMPGNMAAHFSYCD